MSFFSSGMKDGQKIVFHGEGDQEPDLEPGDVIIVLDQKDHSVFQRRGHDLITKMRIQLSEALCGFRKTIETLDNRVLVISTRPGMSFKVPILCKLSTACLLNCTWTGVLGGDCSTWVFFFFLTRLCNRFTRQSLN